MSSVDGTSSTGTSSADILAALNKKSAASSTTSPTATAGASSNTTLGEDTFLKLLVTQMQNQDPLNPQDNSAFVAQLAQFSSLEGITNLNTTVSGLSSSLQSSQALQASALVGRSVEVATNNATLTQGGLVQGTITLPSSTADLQVNVYDSSNNVVYSQDMGTQQAGDLQFGWAGATNAGTTAPAGNYTIKATATDDGKATSLTTYLGNNVDSVTIGANQAVMLNVNGVGQVALSDVKNIL